MKFRLGTAFTTLVLIAAQSVTATAGPAADPAPTGVTIAWADAAHDTIRVNWQETGDLPNKIAVRVAGTNGAGHAHYTGAGQPNEAMISAASLSNSFWSCDVVEVAVWVGTEAGTTSEPAPSAPFDTQIPRSPELSSYTPSGGGTISFSWRGRGPSCSDTTPSDPLDLSGEPLRYQVWVRPSGGLNTPVGPPTTATQATVSRTPPFLLEVTPVNEWTGGYVNPSPWIDAQRTTLVTRVPASATYGKDMTITGSVSLIDGGLRWLILQAQDRPGSSWYEVTRTVQDEDDPGFRFTFHSPGTRAYRVIAPTRRDPDCCKVQFGTTSAPATTVTRYYVAAAKFGRPTASYGQRVQALIHLSPAAEVRTTLQRWDGHTWVGVKWVTTYAGEGDYVFTATRRGTTAYRFLVPSSVERGRAISWVVTPTFRLTVR